ncbi:MAG: hypothetical protein WCL16_00665 [bacterium]
MIIRFKHLLVYGLLAQAGLSLPVRAANIGEPSNVTGVVAARTVLPACVPVQQAAQLDVPASASTDGGLVYVIPIHGVMDEALLYVLRRGLRDAEAKGAQAIVFDFDTPGGRVDTAEEILAMLREVSVPTYAFVNPNAISAGAIIALGMDGIYMTPGSRIGDAMPIMISMFGNIEEMPKAVEEKMASYVAALVRSAAQEKGHDPMLAEAMVRRELGYKVGDAVFAQPGQLLTLTSKDAARLVGPDRHPVLSQGTVADIDELLKLIGLDGCEVIELRVTAAERTATFIESISIILLAAGLLGLYIEFKTPGFGWPGILGLLCLAVWFWGSHIAGLAGYEEMVLFLIGIALIMIEVTVIPGFGVIGVAGFVMVIVALVLAMVQHMPGEPWWHLSLPRLQFGLRNLLAALALVGFAGWGLRHWLPHTSAYRGLVLQTTLTHTKGFQASVPNADWVGRRGVALTLLRPAGTAQFGADRRQVVARGDFLEAGCEIVITETHGSRLVVDASPNEIAPARQA